MDNISHYVFTGLATLLASIISGLYLMYLRPKAKIYYWWPNNFVFNLQNEIKVLSFLRTDVLTVQNIGRDTAKNIQLIFRSHPMHFQINPPLANVTTNTLKYSNDSNSYFVINIASLASKETCTLQILSVHQEVMTSLVPTLIHVRAENGTVERMPFQITRTSPQWIIRMAGFILFIGLVFISYWLIKLGALLFYLLITTNIFQ